MLKAFSLQQTKTAGLRVSRHADPPQRPLDAGAPTSGQEEVSFPALAALVPNDFDDAPHQRDAARIQGVVVQAPGLAEAGKRLELARSPPLPLAAPRQLVADAAGQGWR